MKVLSDRLLAYVSGERDDPLFGVLRELNERPGASHTQLPAIAVRTAQTRQTHALPRHGR